MAGCWCTSGAGDASRCRSRYYAPMPAWIGTSSRWNARISVKHGINRMLEELEEAVGLQAEASRREA